MRSSNITTGHYATIKQYPASAADRVVARLVDLFFITMYITMMIVLVDSMEDLWIMIPEGVLLLIFFVLALPAFAYFPIFELFDGGQTLGKRIMGIRVVQTDGSQLKFSSAILRWLLDLIDVSLGLGLPTMIFSHDNKRIGDYAADTTVINIKENNYNSFDTSAYAFATTNYTPVYNEATRLSTNQIEIIKRVIAYDTDPMLHQTYLDNLANKVVRLLDVQPRPGMNATTFLNVVLCDYLYYASLPDEL